MADDTRDNSFPWRGFALVLAGVVAGGGIGGPTVATLMGGRSSEDTTAIRADVGTIKEDVSQINADFQTFRGYMQAKLENLRAELAEANAKQIDSLGTSYAESFRAMRSELLDRVDRIERRMQEHHP